MTHDPLCPNPLAAKTSCHCDLIARVREERAAEFTRMENAWRDEVDRRERAAWEVNDNQQQAKGYAAALRDAVEAVRALSGWSVRNFCDPEDKAPYAVNITQADAVAAIEALGGER